MRNALVTRDLSVTFGGFKAVDGVSLNVAEGELRVLLGANGAGKTTMMDLISGRTPSTRGEVILYGEEITNWDEHRIARAGVGRKFQIPTIFRDLTVRQNLEVASCRGSGVFALDRRSTKTNVAIRPIGQPHNSSEKRRLTSPIPTQDDCDFTFRNIERKTM